MVRKLYICCGCCCGDRENVIVVGKWIQLASSDDFKFKFASNVTVTRTLYLACKLADQDRDRPRSS